MTEFAVGDEVFGVAGGAQRRVRLPSVRAARSRTSRPGMTFEEARRSATARCIALPACERRPARGEEHPRLRRLGLGRNGRGAARQALRRRRDGRVRHEERRARAFARRRRGRSTTLREDFTKNGETYDVVFDAVGKHSFRRCRRSLKPGGVYIETDLGFMWHVPLARARDAAGRRQAGDARIGRSTRRRTSSSSRS